MERVIVIGCPGAGKSTFVRALRDLSGLPLYYLDQIWHRPDGTNISQPEFDSQLEHILNQQRWILDGNYLRTLERRLLYCDTVFLLDLPLQVCLDGAKSRIGSPREDLPWVEQSFDPEFRQWIEAFPSEQLPQIYSMLEAHGGSKTIFIFRSREEAARYLQQWDSAWKNSEI